jgi:hypothetical protein
LTHRKKAPSIGPLLLYNCAPLSFLDVEQSDYAYATLGVYEQRRVRYFSISFMYDDIL